MQGNQNRLCGPIMSNCCCDSHSTTRRVSCKKGSISSAAQTQACSPPFLLLLLLLLLWDIVGFRGQTLEVEGWGYGKYADSLSTREHKGSVLGFPPAPRDSVSKKCIFRCCIYRIHVDGWPKWCKTCVFTQKSVSVWMASLLVVQDLSYLSEL